MIPIKTKLIFNVTLIHIFLTYSNNEPNSHKEIEELKNTLEKVSTRLDRNDLVSSIGAFAGGLAALLGIWITYSSEINKDYLKDIENSVARNSAATALVAELVDEITNKKSHEIRDIALLTLDSNLSDDIKEARIKKILLKYKITKRLLDKSVTSILNIENLVDSTDTPNEISENEIEISGISELKKNQSIVKEIHINSGRRLDKIIEDDKDGELTVLMEPEIQKIKDYIEEKEKDGYYTSYKETIANSKDKKSNFELAAQIHTEESIRLVSDKTTIKSRTKTDKKISEISEKFLAEQSISKKVIHISVNENIDEKNLETIRKTVKQVANKMQWTTSLTVSQIPEKEIVEKYKSCKSFILYYHDQDEDYADEFFKNVKESINQETSEINFNENEIQQKYPDHRIPHIEENIEEIKKLNQEDENAQREQGQFDIFLIDNKCSS